MCEDLAWDIFLKTGSIESFLEYKKIINLQTGVDGIEKEV